MSPNVLRGVADVQPRGLAVVDAVHRGVDAAASSLARNAIVAATSGGRQAISGTRRWAIANSKSRSSSTSARASWLPVALSLSSWSELTDTPPRQLATAPRPRAREVAVAG